ncbi:MAG: hypothetical protein KDB00_21995 [Planctomycetales bacterium]|nr:hypothetical protein [Planctomycetales bacterium]
MKRITALFFISSCLILAGVETTFSQQTKEPSEESKRYLQQLADATERVEKTVAQIRERGLTAQADMLAKGQLAGYRKSLKEARESVAKGNEFGREEFLAVINGLTESAKADSQRAIIEAQQNAEAAMRENNREFELKIADAKKKYDDAMSDSNEKFRLATETANLKAKFNANRGRIGMVIWNLPIDQNLHKRFTTTVTIELLNGPNVVWTRKNVKLNRKQPNNPIRLPDVVFDTVSVELMKWTGDGGGLAEIEVFLGEDNIAKNRPCEVSSIETLPIHLDDQNALTDGVARPTFAGNGYWIPEGDTKATVMVRLLGKKLPAETTAIPTAKR